jgi:hypothetical protein
MVKQFSETVFKVSRRLSQTYLNACISERFYCQPGLPDGLFSNQKSKFLSFLEGLAMEDAVIFCEQ